MSRPIRQFVLLAPHQRDLSRSRRKRFRSPSAYYKNAVHESLRQLPESRCWRLLEMHSRAAFPLRPESECERPHAGIARHQGQHVLSSRRSGDQANHAGPIEARHSV